MADGTPWYLAARSVMEEFYGDKKDFDHFIKAYDYHQPLRKEIYEAVSQKHPDDKRQKLSDFWNHCAQLVTACDDNGLALYRPWSSSLGSNALKTLPKRSLIQRILGT